MKQHAIFKRLWTFGLGFAVVIGIWLWFANLWQNDYVSQEEYVCLSQKIVEQNKE